MKDLITSFYIECMSATTLIERYETNFEERKNHETEKLCKNESKTGSLNNKEFIIL